MTGGAAVEALVTPVGLELVVVAAVFGVVVVFGEVLVAGVTVVVPVTSEVVAEVLGWAVVSPGVVSGGTGVVIGFVELSGEMELLDVVLMAVVGVVTWPGVVLNVVLLSGCVLVVRGVLWLVGFKVVTIGVEPPVEIVPLL